MINLKPLAKKEHQVGKNENECKQVNYRYILCNINKSNNFMYTEGRGQDSLYGELQRFMVTAVKVW